MTIRNVTEAKAELSALLVMVDHGEEVIIARAGRPIAKLVPLGTRRQPRTLGVFEGKMRMSDDFDAPDPEIERIFYEGPIEPAP